MVGRFVVVGLVTLIAETVIVVAGIFIEMVGDRANAVTRFVGVFVRVVYVGGPEDINIAGSETASIKEQATPNINFDDCKKR
jgi:uncharacterized membrane protein